MRAEQPQKMHIHLSRTTRTALEALYTPLKKMIAGLLRDHGVNRAQISISCVGSTLIRKLNREYLQRDCVTDVIAFDLSAGGSGGIYSPLVGDVYICVPRALEQAARLN